jgi:hypothetical protein
MKLLLAVFRWYNTPVSTVDYRWGFLAGCRVINGADGTMFRYIRDYINSFFTVYPTAQEVAITAMCLRSSWVGIELPWKLLAS